MLRQSIRYFKSFESSISTHCQGITRVNVTNNNLSTKGHHNNKSENDFKVFELS